MKELCSVEDVFNAIRDMTVRGAPLIGAAGAFGIYLATLEITHNTNINSHLAMLQDILFHAARLPLTSHGL